MVEQIAQAYQGLLLPMLGWVVFWYLLSLILKRNDFVDVAWGLGFVYIIFWQAVHTSPGPFQLIVYGVISLWGFRLAIYLLIRNSKKQEDWRYLNWRKEWGKHFYWRSFLQVYVLQSVLMMIIAMPIIIVSLSKLELRYTLLPGIILWLTGFYWQSVGDSQLMKFKADPLNNGKFIQNGLWAKSRHPNYFGEICMWWGVWLIILPVPMAWFGIVSPVMITYLLLRVSGVPMLEKKYDGNPQFEAYKAKVPAVFPKIF